MGKLRDVHARRWSLDPGSRAVNGRPDRESSCSDARPGEAVERLTSSARFRARAVGRSLADHAAASEPLPRIAGPHANGRRLDSPLLHGLEHRAVPVGKPVVGAAVVGEAVVGKAAFCRPFFGGAALALALLCGCDDTSLVPDVTITIVQPDGTRAMDGIEMITIRIREEGGDVDMRSATVSGGNFSIDFPTLGELSMVELGVELSGPSTRLVGAPPAFQPIEAGGAVEIAVGAPGTCQELRFHAIQTTTMDALGVPRSDVAFTQLGTFALALGGESAEGPSTVVTWLDLLQNGHGDIDALMNPVVGARSTPVGRGFTLVASEMPFIYDLERTTTAVRDVSLHEGAGARSAITHYTKLNAMAQPLSSALVAGGGTREAPVAALTFLDATGGREPTLLDKSMMSARADAAIADLDAFVLVAAGMRDANATFAEIVDTTAGTTTAIAFDDGTRYGATLFVRVTDDDDFDALLLGGEDETGMLRTDTVWIHANDGAAVAEPGPTWTNARRGAAFARARSGGFIAGGEGPMTLVERVVITGDAMPAIETFGQLETARARASAFALFEGPLYVAGGQTPAGPSGAVEICFPAEVGPLP
jgi:hypothetical protein